MPCRKTLWSWKKKGQPQCSRGRRLQNKNIAHNTLAKAAALIDEAIVAGGDQSVDHLRVERELPQRWEEIRVRSIFNTLSNWSLPPELIAVATCDVLRVGTRTRRRRQKMIPTKDGIAHALAEKLEISAVQAAIYAQAYVEGDEDEQRWIDWVLEPEQHNRYPVDRRSCISKVFRHITRRMSCYWRQQSKYDQCKKLLGELIGELVKQ